MLARARRSLLLPPAVIAILIAVLGLCKVSGSSIAMLDPGTDSPPAVLDARPIRSDEWSTRTPMVIRQAETGYPRATDIGMGIHDTGVLSDLPVKEVSSVVKPHSWAYFVLGVERGFAIEWWLTAFGPLLGVYVVLAVLTRQRTISLLSGVLVAASPIAAWTAIPSMGLSVLYGGATAAGLIVASRRSGWNRLAVAAFAGWTAAAFAALLYIPWLVPLAIIFGAIVLTQLVGTIVGWRAWLATAAAFGGVFAVFMGVFLVQHRAALEAIASSVYPGQRVTTSGAAVPTLLFSAPFDLFTSTHLFRSVNGANQSAAASGLMLWVPLAVVGGAFRGLRSRRSVDRALPAVMLAGLVLFAWAFLVVPSTLGSLLVLTKVQGERLSHGLTVVGALGAGLFVDRWRRDPSSRPRAGAVAIATALFAGITAWIGALTIIEGAKPDSWRVLVLVSVFAAITAAILRGKVIAGLGAAALLLTISYARVNPIQIGLAPALESPVIAQIDAVRTGDRDGRWIGEGTDFVTSALVAASGAPSASGISWYAFPDEWHRLDPADQHEFTWNRLAKVRFVFDETLPSERLTLPFPDVIDLLTPSCHGALQRFDIRYVVSSVERNSSCLQIVSAPDARGEMWIYAVTS